MLNNLKIRDRLVLLLISSLYIVVAIESDEKLFFTSDGLHYFSALRNFNNFNSLYEGPTFEYLLGNHSYILLYLLSPLLMIYKSYKIFIFINFFILYLSSLYIYKVSIFLNHNYKRRYCLSLTVAILFISSPYLNKYLFSQYLFQPDIFFLLFSTLIIYFLLKKNFRLFCVFSICFLLIKEEAIIAYPITVFSIALVFKENFIFHQKKGIIILSIYLITSLFSLFTLFYFRNLNEINHALRTINLKAIIYQLIYNCPNPLNYVYNLLKPFIFVLPIFVYSLFKNKNHKLLNVLLVLSILIVVKLLLNFIIYNKFLSPSWSNLWIQPLLFTLLINAIFLSTFLRKSNFLNYFFITTALFITVNFNLFTKTHAIKNNKFKKEICEISKSLKPYDKTDYIITYENLVSPFVNNISHCTHQWLLSLNKKDKTIIEKKARLILIKKNNKTNHVNLSNHKLSITTENFFLYEKKERTILN